MNDSQAAKLYRLLVGMGVKDVTFVSSGDHEFVYLADIEHLGDARVFQFRKNKLVVEEAA